MLCAEIAQQRYPFVVTRLALSTPKLPEVVKCIIQREGVAETRLRRPDWNGLGPMQCFIVSDQETISTAGGDRTLAFHRADVLCFQVHPTDADCRSSILHGSIDQE